MNEECDVKFKGRIIFDEKRSKVNKLRNEARIWYGQVVILLVDGKAPSPNTHSHTIEIKLLQVEGSCITD